MKLTRNDVSIVIFFVAIAFLAGIVSESISANYWIGYFTMVGTLILCPNVYFIWKHAFAKNGM